MKRNKKTLVMKKEQSRQRKAPKSRYAKKKAYLKLNGGFGFDYYPSKPWR